LKNLSRTGCGGELQQFNQYVDNGVYDQVYGYGFSDSFNNSVDQQNTLHPMYQTWQLGPTPMTATQDGYGQALTPNSTSSSNLDPSSDQPRARKLNENCRCSYCNKCFQSTWHLKRHERTHTNEKPYNCQKCGKSYSDNSNYSKHIRKCFSGVVDNDILPQLPGAAGSMGGLNEPGANN